MITKARHWTWSESGKFNKCLRNQFVQNSTPSMSGFPEWYLHLKLYNQKFRIY